MSPINVHVTRYPMSGTVNFINIIRKILGCVAPKVFRANERTTIVVENEQFGEVLYRQIAGAVARRIVNYAKVGDKAVQGEDAGFIKFGSRVDLFLPVGTPVDLVLDQVVRGVKLLSQKNKFRLQGC